MLIVAVFIALAGGVIRGITGFGGALVMTPALSSSESDAVHRRDFDGALIFVTDRGAQFPR